MSKKEPMIYTGTEIIGIAQMHKSNAVPIRSKKDAIDISRMRRIMCNYNFFNDWRVT